MNWRPLLPCAGLLGGVLTGWQFREAPAASVVEKRTPAQAAGAFPAVATRAPAVTQLSELHDLWSDDGAVGIYELLDGVPVATLVAWLNELMPPETYSRSLEREKRDGIRDALVERLAERDPSALAAWLLRIPKGHATGGGESGGGWMKTCVHALLHQNSPDALALLDRLEKTEVYAAHQRLVWLAEHDPQAALQRVGGMPGKAPPPELARWIAADPARGLVFANEHPDRCFTVLEVVAEKGNAALREFSAGLTAPEAQRHSQRLLVHTAAGEGDTAVMAQLLKQHGRNESDYWQDEAFATLARMHPEKAEALMQQFADQPALATPLFTELAQTHPERAAALLTTHAAQPGYWDAMYQISRTWSLTDPAAAQTWLRELPEEQRARAMPVARHIADDLPTADWLALTRGLPIAWNHASNFSTQILERTRDPAVLAEWCAAFPDSARGHLLNQFRQQLNDPAAADDITRRVDAALSPETP